MNIYAFDVNNYAYKDKDLWNFVYLHGKLQYENGFDLVACDCKPGKPGIYNATVHLHNGEIRKAKLYYWKTNIERGLVVAIDDLEHLLDAEQKYKRRVEIL